VNPVPGGWQRLALKRLALPGGFTDGDWVESPYITNEGVRLLQTGNIGIGKFKEQGFRYISEHSFHVLRCTEVKPGDVLVCRLADPVGRACSAPDLGVKTVTSVDVAILRPKPEYDSRFIVYALSSESYLGYLQSICRGGTRDRVSRSMLGDVQVPMPPHRRQRAIADFLDRKTAAIDALIEKKQLLIALCDDRRKALIDRVVLGGTRVPAERKETGTVLGSIPAGWQVKRLMHLTTTQRPIMYGIVLPGPNVEDGVAIVKSGNCTPATLRFEMLHKTTYEIESGYARSRLKKDDIVFAIRGSVGMSALVPEEVAGANLTQDAARIAPAEGLNPRWLLYVVQSSSVWVQLEAGVVGATVKGINIRDLKRPCVPVPSRAEQDEIADFLDREIGHLHELEAATERSVEKLREYRQALITAAVTGQLDVAAQEAA
jgi:type I restriction enzyme S subunit